MKPRPSQMDALTNAAMLEVKKEPAIHVARYTLTPAGARVAPRFCFGHREVTVIDSSTPPAKGRSGFVESRVEYHYKNGRQPHLGQRPRRHHRLPRPVHGRQRQRHRQDHPRQHRPRVVGPRVDRGPSPHSFRHTAGDPLLSSRHPARPCLTEPRTTSYSRRTASAPYFRSSRRTVKCPWARR